MLYIRQLFHNAVHCEIAISYEKIPTSFHCYPTNKYACIVDKKKVQQKKAKPYLYFYSEIQYIY